MHRYVLILLLVLAFGSSRATSLLIPMDGSQRNHLKAYGIAYYILKKGGEVDWLLNYRGGSFLIANSIAIENECTVRGVSFEIWTAEKTNSILAEISSPSVNMNVVNLQTAPKIAVYRVEW